MRIINNKLLVKKLIVIFLFVIFSFWLVDFAVAGELRGLENTAREVGYEKFDISAKEWIPTYVGFIIRAVLGFIGIIFMVLILMGAFAIQGAGGNDEVVKAGKLKIKNGAIGLAIVLAAYLIANTFLHWLTSGVFIVE